MVRRGARFAVTEADRGPWRTDSGRELGMVGCGRVQRAKAFHMRRLLFVELGRLRRMAWTPATRVHEPWPVAPALRSWSFFPPTAFKQFLPFVDLSPHSLLHSLRSACHRSFCQPLPSLHHLPSHLLRAGTSWLSRPAFSHLPSLTQDFAAPSLPAR